MDPGSRANETAVPEWKIRRFLTLASPKTDVTDKRGYADDVDRRELERTIEAWKTQDWSRPQTIAELEGRFLDQLMSEYERIQVFVDCKAGGISRRLSMVEASAYKEEELTMKHRLPGKAAAQFNNRLLRRERMHTTS
jgi:hypothetical protein